MISSSRRLSRSLMIDMLVLGGAVGSCARSPAASAPAPVPARAAGVASPTSGADVIRAMHDRYASTWYHSLTFVQKSTIFLPSGGTLVQTWLEAGKMPGRLRIDTDSMRQAGVIYSGDSVYQFAGGRLARADTGMNELLILGFDVYAQPANETIAILRRRGFDLSKLSRGTWEQRPAYMIGAGEGDTTSKQFWIDAERLLFVRLLDPRRTSTGMRRDDIRFQKYVRHGGGWVAEEVMMYRDGKPSLREEYADVRVDVPLSDALFDPRRWSTAEHWYQK
jgi:hypothetical protein